MAFLLKVNDDPKVWFVEGKRMTHVTTKAHQTALAQANGIPDAPAVVDRAQFNLLIEDRERYGG